ncbi:hypothetical protein BBAD15_g9664 [Beauveria bassiana D1-5]|uniref:Cytochrome b561 domain-containing protein n=1 Tax=Beauveria bassiana D1-5 TaxID=1245745 RepID=A0A0A2VB09_BEABA|nr:hypothetical protein BBAD15_g9664 [Beauveria bassiana D1-5]
MAPSSAFSQGSAPIQRNKAAEVNAQANQGQPHQPEIAFSMAQLWDDCRRHLFPVPVREAPGTAPDALLVASAITAPRPVPAPPVRPRAAAHAHRWPEARRPDRARRAQFCLLYRLCRRLLRHLPQQGAQRGRGAAAGAGAASVVAHFTTLHGALGATLTAMLAGQHVVGLTMWAVPALYGGEARARSMWKLHRASGYVSLLLLLATFGTAAGTGFVRNALEIESWVFYVPMALIAVGVLPRIHASKLGFSTKKA